MYGDSPAESDLGSRAWVSEIEEGLFHKKPEENLKRHLRSDLLNPFNSPFRITFSRKPAPPPESPWPKIVKGILYIQTVGIILALVAGVIYFSLCLHLVRRISPAKVPDSGLSHIVTSWVEPGSVTPAPPSWLPDFSRDIQPKEIHSHNDYWRPVPLFDALSLGVTAVEADCHLVNGELYVGHSNSLLKPSRTLRENLTPSGGINGVWDVDPSRGIVLMTDLKTEGFSTLDAVQQQLEPLRQKGWLTSWNGTAIVPGPITHVGTGNTPFEAVLNSSYSNATYRSVFFDAPLHNLSNIYNFSNSYYASTSLTSVLDGGLKIALSGLSKGQMSIVKAQVDQATGLGLVSRYWDIPPWPVNRRVRIWNQLQGLGSSMLNVDAIEEAARWNWTWCNILGLQLC